MPAAVRRGTLLDRHRRRDGGRRREQFRAQRTDVAFDLRARRQDERAQHLARDDPEIALLVAEPVFEHADVRVDEFVLDFRERQRGRMLQLGVARIRRADAAARGVERAAASSMRASSAARPVRVVFGELRELIRERVQRVLGVALGGDQFRIDILVDVDRAFGELILQLARARALGDDSAARGVAAIRFRMIELHQNVDLERVIRRASCRNSSCEDPAR